MHKTDSYEETGQKEHQDFLEKQRNYLQIRQFARLFLHLGLLPLAYIFWQISNRVSNIAIFESEVFSLSFWFLTFIFVTAVSQRQKRYIRDSGLRSFYMFAVAAVSLMLALNMTGILT